MSHKWHKTRQRCPSVVYFSKTHKVCSVSQWLENFSIFRARAKFAPFPGMISLFWWMLGSRQLSSNAKWLQILSPILYSTKWRPSRSIFRYYCVTFWLMTSSDGFVWNFPMTLTLSRLRPYLASAPFTGAPFGYPLLWTWISNLYQLRFKSLGSLFQEYYPLKMLVWNWWELSTLVSKNGFSRVENLQTRFSGSFHKKKTAFFCLFKSVKTVSELMNQ